MNRKVLIVILAVLLVIFAITFFFRDSVKTTSQKACDALTLSEIKQVIGDKAQRDPSEAKPDQNTEDLLVTYCPYVVEPEKADASDAKTASLTIYAAKTQKGVDVNAAHFTPEQIGSAETVEGVGDQAYWSKLAGFLYALKGNDYYVISAANGPGGAASLDELKAIAAKAEL
jgi:hypothetical protein